jgi:hypothetical protein
VKWSPPSVDQYIPFVDAPSRHPTIASSLPDAPLVPGCSVMSLTMFWTMSPGAAFTPRIRVHDVWPGSIRNRPCDVAAYTRCAGSTRIFQMSAPSSCVPPTCDHVEPPSVDFITPTPAYESLLVFDSPVPT